jgi:hypothetical protein
MREPVARFRVNMDFVGRMAFDFAGVNAEDEMPVSGSRVEFLLLRDGQIPVGVKPVRIARGEK